MTPPPPPSTPPFRCPLPGIGVLLVTGADATEFLHGQLSSDVRAMAPGQAQYSSYNSPKGRMLATLVVARTADGGGYRLLLAADLAEPIRKRLAMFVLRSRVAVTDATAATTRLGLAGDGAGAALAAAFGRAPDPLESVERGPALALALPDGRFIVLAGTEGAPDVPAAIAAALPAGDEAAWMRLGIRAGVPMVTAATSDQFVAQTANWDLLGGVNFHKGCYPGQEIVARTQYLGRLKERLHLFRTDAPPPAAGTRLYGATFGDQACGTVVNAAAVPGGGSELAAVVQTAAADAGGLRLGAPDGPALAALALPYEIPAPGARPGRIA